jgi:hypothetical protein
MVLDEVIVTLLLEEVRINFLNPLMRPSLFMKNQWRNERREKMMDPNLVEDISFLESPRKNVGIAVSVGFY